MKKTYNSEELRESMRMLERKLGILQKAEMSCCGVTFSQCHAIVEIGRAGTISLNELAELLGLDISTMSRTVSNLVNSGQAEREINPEDRRYVNITLTEKGIRVFREIEDSMNIYYSKIFDNIPEDRKQQVVESIKLLLEAIRDSNCCG